jgi:hypothetical protein
VLAEGELTGHRHAIFDRVTMFRDDALAREVPGGLYVGHIKVEGGSATILHQEHAPIALGEGTYRVRRQRESRAHRRDACLGLNREKPGRWCETLVSHHCPTRSRALD